MGEASFFGTILPFTISRSAVESSRDQFRVGRGLPVAFVLLDRYDLRKRGWTRTMIENYLQGVGHREPVWNGYYNDKCVYPEVDVVAIERTPKFQKVYQCSLARRRVSPGLAKQFLANRTRHG